MMESISFVDEAEEEMYEKLLKVIIIGDDQVGKSTFVDRYIDGKLRCTSAGVDFALKIVKCQQQTVKLQLWDINGQPGRCSSIMKLYYRDTSACVIMFDVTQRETFGNVMQWKNNVETLSNVSPIPCLLLANKADLPSPSVCDEEIEELCKNNDFIGWGKISVKDNTNIEGIMQFLVEKTLLGPSLLRQLYIQ